MLCDVCRERDATVTLTHAVKGEVNVLHLCQRCAADRGIETSITTPLKNMIADYLPAVQAQTLAAQAESIKCAFCSMSLADFRETGRLGCASCYTTFDQSLRALLFELILEALDRGAARLRPGLLGLATVVRRRRSPRRLLGAFREHSVAK
jgi:protein arginine kinase activator